MKKISRRTILASLAALGMTVKSKRSKALPAKPTIPQSIDTHTPKSILVQSHGTSEMKGPADGQYKAVDLAKDKIRLSVVQSRVRGVDVDRLRVTRRENLEHMLALIDVANNWGGPKDLLLFHEFPITGYSNLWNKTDALKVAIEIPGEETEAIGKKAQEYGCYIVFGSYVRDDNWPNHLLSITSIINPDGDIIAKHWKARNIKGVFGPGFELFTTTIYDVLDEYIERYGLDAVIPIARTPIGNIATSTVQREPELFRAFAMKGAEIILRLATGGYSKPDVMVTSLYNRVYTAIANNAISPGNTGFFTDSGSSGESAIYGPKGELLKEANSEHETAVTTTIPIASFRQSHRIPQVHLDLYHPIYEQYVNQFPPNLFSEYQPQDNRDAYEYLRHKSIW